MKTRSLKNNIYIIALAICLPVAISSCNSGNAQPPIPLLDNAEAVSSDGQVVIEHMAYNPDTLIVTKGTKVTWTDNQAIMPHTVMSDTKGLFDSGNLHKKDIFSYTFNTAGTFTYYCEHHKKMHGAVIVK